MKTKGIILAAGKGTRLMPATIPASKPLLPLYDKPMIYYPLETLIRLGIKDILFIVQEDDLLIFKKTFGSGSDVGLNFSYEIQNVQRGIADAYFIADKYLDGSPSVLALSDNIFLGKKYFDYANSALFKMQDVGGSVEGSMQYLLKSWPTIIELASVYKRLREFERKLKATAGTAKVSE